MLIADYFGLIGKMSDIIDMRKNRIQQFLTSYSDSEWISHYFARTTFGCVQIIYFCRRF